MLVVAVIMGVAGCSVAVSGTAAPDPAATAAASTTSAGPPAGSSAIPVPFQAGTKFADTAGRFSIVPPKDWKVDSSGTANALVFFYAPTVLPTAKGSFAPNINVTSSPFSGDLAALIVGFRRELKGTAGYTSVGETEVVLSDGTPAHLVGGTFTDAGSGLTVRNLQLFTVHEGNTIIVTGTGLPDSWDAYASTLESSLRTLTVTP